MDFNTVSPEEFGASLRGIGFNIIVSDVKRTTQFLIDVFDMTAFRISNDFAIIRHQDHIFQLHGDGAYHSNPLLSLIPENPPRGGGIEIQIYNADPDLAAEKAIKAGGHVLQQPTDKPHGLRECYILCTDGYAWVPSRPT